MKKSIIFIGLVMLLVLAVGCSKIKGGCTEEAKICPDGSSVGRTGLNCEFAPCPGDNGQLIGGQKDEHGCLIAAGYSWCEAKQKCLRVWEENCTEGGDGTPTVCTMEAKICPDGSSVGRTGPNCEFAPCPGEGAATQCANEGEYTSGAGCCEGLKEFDTIPSAASEKSYLCYNASKGTPQCKAVGSRSEGWYYTNPQSLLRYESCGGSSGTNTASSGAERTHMCTTQEKANNACTMEYMPVCGEIVLNAGKKIHQTFGNKCSACAAMKVVSYAPGECPPDVSTIVCSDQKGNYLTMQDAINIAKPSECGDKLIADCTCPEGYRKESGLCNPECYYGTPKCLAPSVQCEKTFVCNEGTDTFWINLNMTKQGCYPACVINLETKHAEINWRCTGLIPQ